MRLLRPGEAREEFRNRCALGVMVKAPRAGQVKTRLAPPLSLEEAAELNRCFLRDTLGNLGGAEGGVAVVVYTPAGEEAAFAGLVGEEQEMLLQRGDGFGERLAAAAEDLLSCGFGAVCLIDSDSPTMPARAIEGAVRALQQSGERVVLGGTDDGGYYLIGLKRARRRLFEGVRWSTETVFAETLERAAELGLDVTLLPRWYDVDSGGTLARLCDELLAGGGSGDGYAAPHTRRYLETLVKSEREQPLWIAPRQDVR